MNLLMKFQFTVLFVAIFASATCWGKALQVQEVDLLMKIAEGASGLIIKTEKMPAMQRLEEFESILDASTYQGYKAAITEKKDMAELVILDECGYLDAIGCFEKISSSSGYSKAIEDNATLGCLVLAGKEKGGGWLVTTTIFIKKNEDWKLAGSNASTKRSEFELPESEIADAEKLCWKS